MDFVMITGMSGAGKSRAVAAMEDIGYYCVDNLPPRMVKSFTELCVKAPDKMDKVAIVVDARSREIFGDIFESVEDFIDTCGFRLLFLDCDENVLIQRFKETRRRHPLMNEKMASVEEAIARERQMMKRIRESADYLIDTTYLSVSQLREKISGFFLEDQKQGMLVNCMSFGFKYGLPKESDLVFDVRCLPNPFYISELRPLTGLNEPVREYVLEREEAQKLIPKLLDLVDYLIPMYQKEGKTQLTIGVGCTGGKHRSVVFAQLLGEHLAQQKVRTTITHRDIAKRKD